MVPLSSVSHPSVHLSVCNGCIVDKHRVIEKKLFAWIISFVSMLSEYKILGMQCKGNIFKSGVE